MTLVIPTVPSIPVGSIATSVQMNELSACCTFLLAKPLLHVTDNTGGLNITTGNLAVTFTTEDLDTDGMFSAPSQRVIVQTPGWYRLSYGINLNGTTLTNGFIQSTTGANNPAGAGAASAFILGSYSRPATPGWCGAAGIWPYYMYAGDYWQTLVTAQASGMSTGTTTQGSWFCAEYVST